MLIIFSGLPGAGKTTLARELAQRLGAFYVRVDSIETALAGGAGRGLEIVDEGYRVGYALARDNLHLGADVVADSVNSISVTREAWHRTAHAAGTRYVDVEVICSDTAEHRSRVETRKADILGHEVPTWQEVLQREYEPWAEPPVVVDTAGRKVPECVDELLQKVRAMAR